MQRCLKKGKDFAQILYLPLSSTDKGSYYTLGQLQKLNKNDKDYYIQSIKDIFAIKSNDYKDQHIIKIIFSFGLREGLTTVKKVIKPVNNYQNYRHGV